MSEYVKYGRAQILRSSLDGLSFEEAKEKHPTIKESLLRGAWDIVNPKGKLKKSKKDEE
jgi:hypothetical protein